MSKWFSISQVCDSPAAIVPVASEPRLIAVQSPVNDTIGPEISYSIEPPPASLSNSSSNNSISA
jgi:hypothetical protein